MTRDLFSRAGLSDVVDADRASVNGILERSHYLGPADRGIAYEDEAGCLVFSAPTSRRLPLDWLDLVRWCILDRSPNAGSRQWARVVAWLRRRFPAATTVVSYSDPSAGHDGALYRATNWRWAPTWHRLRPPPTGLGTWDGETMQAVKDRWVFLLAPDVRREAILGVTDESLLRRMPWASYVEPTWRRGVPQGGGADYKPCLSG